MSFEEDLLARMRGADQARRAAAAVPAADASTQQEAPNWLGGFLGSTVSGFGELFGADASQSAQTFRAENPIAGFASQLVGPVGAYSGMFKLSTTARGAALLDSTMARIPGVRALSAVDNPIAYGAVREAVRYSPLELSKLGVGFALADDPGDYGDMLADVGISTLLTGGFGAIGGFFRAGGTRVPDVGRVVGADLAFKPTFEYRMSRAADAAVTGEVPISDVQNQLFRQIFTERPFDQPIRGIRQRYVDELAGGTPETDALINTLFKPSGADSKALLRQPLMNKAGLWNVDDAGRQELLGALGFDSMEQLAERAVFPRLVTVKSPRAAGTMARILDESPALQFVDDGVMLAREGNTGLFVVAKRLRAGTPIDAPNSGLRRALGIESGEAAAKVPLDSPGAVRGATSRATVIADGDQWLLLKTDQPQHFVPQAHKVAELNVAQWAKYREAFKPAAAPDIFNRSANMLNEVFTPADFRDLKSLTRPNAVVKITEKLADKFGDVSGLKGSATYRSMAEAIYERVKPTMFLENHNPLYQRLWAHLRNSMGVADETVNRIMGGAIKVKGSPLFKRNVVHGEGFAGNRPVEQLVRELDQDELQLVVRAAQSQTPADDLAKLSVDGLVSPRAAAAVAELQAINKSFWEETLLPAFKSANLGKEFDLLEGYIMPRMFKGDWFVPVVDEAGNTMWMASGTLGGAKHEADAVIAEAAERGLKWKQGAEKATHVSQRDVDEIGGISDLVRMQMGASKETQEVVQTAIRKLELARAGNKRGGALPNTAPSKRLTTARTGLGGSPDNVVYTVDDVMESIQSHYQQLGRFAGYHTWRERWLPEAFNLEKISKTLHDDLRRKANQMMGIEGEITKTLDKTLAPIFGHHLGGKAATRIAQATNALMYNWNLAIANPTFALLNLMNPLQTVAPWISMMTKAPTEAVEKLMQVSLRTDSAGRAAGTLSTWHPMKVLGQGLKELRAPGDELLEALGRAKTDGSISPQLYEGWVGGQSRAHQTLRDAYHNAGGGFNGGWEFIKRTSTFMAEKSEEFSRMMAFTSAHILGRDHFGLAGDALYQFSKRATHVTMYGYGVVDRSRIFTGPVGSMAGLFKNWQFHFIGNMAQYAGLGMKQGVWAPMLWQGGAALALGGIGATPLKMMADGLASWHDGSPSSYLWLQENWQDSADELYFGLPALLGASLQASATTPGTDVRNDIVNLANVVFIQRVKQAATAVGGAWDMWSAGDTNPLRDGNTRDKLLQAFAPRAVFRLFAATEGNYIKSMTTGYPQVRDVSTSGRLLHGLGFNQVEIERQQVAGKELWKDQERERLMIEQLGIRFADAQIAGDKEEMDAVVVRALGLSVPMSSVLKSAHTRMRREQESDNLSRFKAEDAERYRRVFGQ